MAMKPTHQQAAQGSALAARLAKHSIEQAQTALKLSAALSLERLRLICPESDAYDIRRLSRHMAELCEKLRDPLAAIKLVAERGLLDSTFGAGEGFAKPTLRRACASLALEIEAAGAALPDKIAGSIKALDELSLAAQALGMESANPASQNPGGLQARQNAIRP